MKIGDKARDKPTFGDQIRPRVDNYVSEVIYIHPERRFYRARFTFLPVGMSFVESFFLGNRRGNA